MQLPAAVRESAVRLGRGPRLLSLHKDSFELFWQAPPRHTGFVTWKDYVMERGDKARELLGRPAVHTRWEWSRKPIVCHPELPAEAPARAIALLSTQDWKLFVAPNGLFLQPETDYLLQVGAWNAYRAVTEHLAAIWPELPLHRWTVCRTDFTADLAGRRMRLSDQNNSTTRAKKKKAWQEVNHEMENRRLQSLIWGRRGAAVYARIYRKSALPDSVLAVLWGLGAGEALPDDLEVWRIEFEVRKAHLKTYFGGRGTDPDWLFKEGLDHVWEYLTSEWLILGPRRKKGCAGEAYAWWTALSQQRFTGEAGRVLLDLRTGRRNSVSAEEQVPSIVGSLAGVGAKIGATTIEECFAYVRRIVEARGAGYFDDKLELARRRMPEYSVAGDELDAAVEALLDKRQ